jgi:hypothetical protein
MRLYFIILCLLAGICSRAQDNYEIQVYESPTVEKGCTMLELHSNYTFGGQLFTQDGVLPTHHMLHETVEITHGFTPWFETGFYLFNAIGSDNRTTYVGSHIRPRVTVPASWHWPAGVSLSIEAGYQKPQYCADDWTLEIRPIVDKTWNRFYFSFNPVFDRALHGADVGQGFVFSPAFKARYSITKKVAAGLEYYGSVGGVSMYTPFQQQQHQLFAAIDLDWCADWEFNAGYGLGFTNAADNDIFKVILGYRLHQKAANEASR